MPREANILAFEDVKKTVPRSRSAVPNAKKQTRPAKRGSQPSTRRRSVASESRPRNSAPFEERSAKRDERKSAPKSQRSSPPRAKPQRFASEVNTRKNTRSPDANSTRRTDSRNASQAERTSQSPKTSLFSDLKRSYAKAKADRSFTKQFAGKEPSNASSENAPRAALYKAEMGKTHKRSTRAQATAAPSSSRSPKSREEKRFSLKSPKVMTSLAVVACLIFACAFIYPTAQQYYVTSREHAQLQAEYDALVQRKEALNSEVTSLQTPEGVENRARQEFGWVKQGENAVNVYGLDVDSDSSSFTKTVPAGSVPAPETWYSEILDFIFNV